MQSPSAKRKIESDEDEDLPLSTRKKPKKAIAKAKNKKRKYEDDSETEDVVIFYFEINPANRRTWAKIRYHIAFVIETKKEEFKDEIRKR